MPTGPNGEKRPANTISCAVHVMKIATGEIEETIPKKRSSKLLPTGSDNDGSSDLMPLVAAPEEHS